MHRLFKRSLELDEELVDISRVYNVTFRVKNKQTNINNDYNDKEENKRKEWMAYLT